MEEAMSNKQNSAKAPASGVLPVPTLGNVPAAVALVLEVFSRHLAITRKTPASTVQGSNPVNLRGL
jgi:hypothetical protein